MRTEVPKVSSESRLLSIAEAASFLGVSAWHVRRLVWGGDLPAVRIGRLVRLDVTDLHVFIRDNKITSGEAQ
jgi:excisionase family DNA binding protein